MAGLPPMALLALTACPGCGGQDDGAPDAAVIELGAEDLVTVTRGTVRAGPRISGQLEAARQAAVRAEIGGSVLDVQAEEGERVSRGQLLARIEAIAVADELRSAQVAAAAAQSELAVAERQLERVAALEQAGALAIRDVELARNALDAARSRLASARAQVASARERLDGATVFAPISGIVRERAVGLGDVVAPGAALYTIVDPSSLRLSAQVPSRALSELRVGQPVLFEVRALPDRRFEGTVKTIAPAVDPATGQIPVLVSLPNPDEILLAGLFVEGRIVAELERGLVAPTSAIATRDRGATSVLRVEEGRVREIPVEIGLLDEVNEEVALLGRVKEGDRLLVGAARALRPGTPVHLPRDTAPKQRPVGG